MSANPGRTTYHQTNIQAQRFTPSPFTGESSQHIMAAAGHYDDAKPP